MKYFSDLKVGDEIYFSDKFCELDKVKVLEINHNEPKNPLFFSIRVSDIEDHDGWFLVTKKGYQSKGFNCRTKDTILAGCIYTSIEGYKKSNSIEIKRELDKLNDKKSELELCIQSCLLSLDKLEKL